MPKTSLPTLKVSHRLRTNAIDNATDSNLKSKSGARSHNSQNTRRKEDQEAMDKAVDEWMAYTTVKAAELAERFDKKQRYFLDRFFAGGKKLIHKQTVTNAFNAFKSIKAAELRADGEKENAIQIQKQYKEEYEALDPEQRAEYVSEFEATKETQALVKRHTSRGCIQDVANTARNMEILLDGLKTRVGVEGFFLIVRNNTEFHASPAWYFTSRELHDYMPVAVGKKWSAERVAAKLEAFAIAGSDVINLNRTSQQKASYMKREITDLIGTKLIAITNNPKVIMQYVNYEADIVLKYGVLLVGWTHDKFCNPSELSNALEPLRTLLEALQMDTCRFVQLTPAERRARQEKYNSGLASGAVLAKKRKTRKDAGVKRKGDADDATFPTDAPPAKRIRSAETVQDSDSEEVQGSVSDQPAA